MRLSCFFLLLLPFATYAHSQNLVGASDNHVRVLSSDANGVIIEFAISPDEEKTPPFLVESIELEGQIFQRLTLKGLTHISEEGKPQLPVKGILLQIPEHARVNLQVESKESRIYSGYRIPPALGMEGRPVGISQFMNNRLYFDSAVYSKDAFYPQKPAAIGILGFLRDVRVVSVIIYPIQYNPVRNQVKFHRRLRITISFQNSKQIDRQYRAPTSRQSLSPPAANSDFQQLYRNLIVNFDPNSLPIKSSIAEAPKKANNFSPLAAYKLIVNQDGIYRLTYQDLKQAGIDVSTIDPKTLKLTNKGKAIPIFVSGENDGKFDTYDYLEFWGEFNRGKYSIFGEYTTENVYWLSWSKGRGARMVREDAAPADDRSIVTTPESYRAVVHFEQDNTRGSLGYADEKRDIWFWKNMAPGIFEYPFELHDIQRNTKSIIRVMLHGYTLTNHRISVSVNNISLSNIQWQGQKKYLLEIPFDSAFLKEGENILKLALRGGVSEGEDRVFFNWFEIEYWRAFRAIDDKIEFEIAGKGSHRFKITGFSNPAIEVYKSGFSKLTNVKIERERTDEINGNVYSLTFSDEIIQPTKYIALTAQNKKKPKAIVKDEPSFLRSPSNGADYIIIVYDEFYEDVLPLAKYRGNRFRTAVVKVQDIYDEFSWGLLSPEAIRDFIRYAYNYWRPPAPAYVFLVGDATWDFKHGKNYIPAYYVHTYKWGPTASDHFYASVNGDDPFPDLFIGRITPRTKEATRAIVEKIIRYEKQPVLGDWRRSLLMLAAVGGFINDSEQLLSDYVPPELGYKVARVYTDPKSKYYGDTPQLLDFWNAGSSFIHFTGHGGGNVWADSNLFTLNDVQFLSNKNRLAFVASFTCFTGYFDDPTKSGLNEEFVNSPGGAIAAFGSTGLGWVHGDYYLEKALFNALFSLGIRRIGSVIAETKISTLAAYPRVDMVSLFNLLGDAATLMPLPRYKIALMSYLVGDKNTPLEDRWIHVRGAIDEQFDGQVLVEIYKRLAPNELQIYSPNYQTKLQVNNGRFSGRLVKLSEISRRIEKQDSGNPQQDIIIRCYAWNDTKGIDAIGATLLRVAGEDDADLSIFPDDIRFTVIPQSGDYTSLKVKLQAIIYNLGQKPAFSIGVRFYKGPPYAGGAIIGSVVIPSIGSGQNATAEIDYSPNLEAETIYVQIDPGNNTPESNETNNIAQKRLKFNSYTITPKEGSDGAISSLDRNLTVTIPKGAVSEAVQFSIESISIPRIINQPDLQYAPLPQRADGGVYRLSVSNENTINSGTFSIQLTFRYDANHTDNSQPDNLAIYRQNDKQLWEIASNDIQRESGRIKATVNQLGIFSLIRCGDSLPPLIQLTLTDEQFAHDGVFASKNPTLSAIIEDANGVGKVQAFINGKPVETDELTFSHSPSAANAIVLEYTPMLDVGDYLFAVEASDTSGNLAKEELSFRVGGELKILNIANHPNPFSKETYFTYVLTQPVEKVSIKIYSSSGRLIAQLEDAPSRTGYNEILWDGKDESGEDIANGIYFYKIIVKTQNGKLSKIGKLAVIR